MDCCSKKDYQCVRIDCSLAKNGINRFINLAKENETKIGILRGF